MNVRSQVIINFQGFLLHLIIIFRVSRVRVVSVQCTAGCGRLEAEELEAMMTKRRPDLGLGPGVLWVTVSFL